MADTNIAYQIARIQGNINNAYSALYDKGATMPATNNSALLADTINTISTGGGGSDEIGSYMIVNGVAEKQVGYINGRFKGIVSINNGAMQSIFSGSGLSGEANFSNLVEIKDRGLYGCFNNCKNITGMNFNKLEYINGSAGMQQCFSNNTNLEGSVNFPSLQSIGSSGMQLAFVDCNKLSGDVNFCNVTYIGSSGLSQIFNTSGYYTVMNVGKNAEINFSSLQVLNGTYAMNVFFSHRGDNTRLNFNSLQVINGQYAMNYAFSQANLYENITFPSLTTINAIGAMMQAFSQTPIRTVNFPSLTDVRGASAMNMTFYSCQNLTDVLMPNLTNINASSAGAQDYTFGSCFSYCPNLVNVDLSKLTNVGDYGLQQAFYACGNLSSINLPSLANVGNYGLSSMFSGCNKLSIVAIGNQTYAPTRNTYFYLQDVNMANGAFSSICQGITSGFEEIKIRYSDTVNLHSIGINAFREGFRNTPAWYFNLEGLNTISSIESNAFTNALRGTTLHPNAQGEKGIIHINCGGNIKSLAFDNAFASSNAFDGVYFRIDTVGTNAFRNAFASGVYDTVEIQAATNGYIKGNANAFTNAFYGSSVMQLSISFSDITNSTDVYGGMLNGVDGCEVYLPYEFKNTMENWSSVQSNFGGTNIGIVYEGEPEDLGPGGCN